MQTNEVVEISEAETRHLICKMTVSTNYVALPFGSFLSEDPCIEFEAKTFSYYPAIKTQ
jgi:hypothetical protein